MYKILSETTILRVHDNAFIPRDEANPDYCAFLAWVELGNEPDVYTPPVIVPTVISKAQGKIALMEAGLWQHILDYINAIENPLQKMKAEVSLNDTYEWRRDSPFLNEAANSLGLSKEDLDGLFITASKIIA